MERTERQRQEDDLAYQEAVKAYERGIADATAGRPADPDAPIQAHYTAGYEEGLTNPD